MRRRSKAAGCFLLVGVTAGAQQANVPKWPHVRVNVSIVDRSGAPAVGVNADALEIRDGKSVVQDAVLHPVGDEPESVCLLVDTSGSTYEARNAVHAEVGKLIDKLPGTDEMCLVDFSSSAYVDAPLTTDRALVRKGVSYLRSSGGSVLLDAVESTARYMQKNAHFERRVIVLVSDGGENASKMSEDEVWRELHRPEAPVVYSIQNPSAASSGSTAGWKLLLNLSERTGGLAFPVNTENEALQATDYLIEAIQGRYELEFTSGNPAADGSVRKLRVELTNDLRKQKFKVVGADGYVAERQ
ncbi:MAG TPA: VWA domain-containing protein [Acidobacteriaceae bacterium]|nr:VWA domain-containing protein [Acidobacteriaceae bacterium]